MKHKIWLAWLGCLLLFGLVGCTPSATAPSATATAAVPTATVTPTATLPPARLVLLAPEGNDPALMAWLEDQAKTAGLILDTRNPLNPVDLDEQVRVVVLLAPVVNLKDLLVAAPQAQFVTLSTTDLESTDHLTVIRLKEEDQAYMAGYIASILSDAWRAGGLFANESPAEQAAFSNGGAYLCGTCSPGWPLKVTFPVVGGIPASSDGAAWVADAQNMAENGKVEVFYLSADAYKPELFSYLSGLKQLDVPVTLLGAQTPPDSLKAQWAATVKLDPLEALKKALPEALAGKSAGVMAVPVQIADVNPDVFSAGRLEQAQKILDGLASGFLQSGTVPPAQ